MALSQIQPTIRISDNNLAWIIRTSRSLRSTMWDRFNTADRVTRESHDQTEMMVSPYAGYPMRDALIIALGNLYSAVSQQNSNWSLTAFWQRPVEVHKEELNKLIACAPHEEITDADVETILSLIVPSLALKKLEQAIKTGGYRPSVVHNWWEQAVRAYRRLLFAPADLAMTEETRAQLLEDAKKLIDLIEAEHLACQQTQEEIDRLRAEADQLIADFKGKCWDVNVSMSELFKAWQATKNSLVEIDDAMATAKASWSQDTAQKALEDIALITPNEPPTPIMKS